MDAMSRAGSFPRERRSIPARPHGFTLLEILIAVAIVSLVVVTVYGSFRTVLGSVEKVDKDQARLRVADFLTTHFEKNISGAYLPSAGRLAQGIEFIGQDQQSTDGRAIDVLTFYTTASRMGGGALPGDTKQVAYGMVDQGDGWYMFTVYEKPRLMVPLTGIENNGLSQDRASWTVPMASLDFQYYDGVEWFNSWDSGSLGELPTAVKIEARFVEKRFEAFAESAGIQDPVLAMIVSIPLGVSQKISGG